MFFYSTIYIIVSSARHRGLPSLQKNFLLRYRFNFAWGKKIGFTSLYSELVRIQNIDRNEWSNETTKGLFKDYFKVEDDILFLSIHHEVEARLLNKDGIIQVGEYIGTFAQGLNVWTTANYIDQLVDGMKSKNLPKGDHFIVFDDTFLDPTKDVTATITVCPLAVSYASPYTLLDNNNGRRIYSNFFFQSLTTPLPNGLRNYDCNFFVNSLSYKKNFWGWSHYKTDHYLSIDIRTVPNWGLSGGWTSILQNQETDYGRKTAYIENNIVSYRNVTPNFLATVGMNLMLSIPLANNSSSTGTSASHRGMGSTNYVRHNCN